MVNDKRLIFYDLFFCKLNSLAICMALYTFKTLPDFESSENFAFLPLPLGTSTSILYGVLENHRSY